MSDRCHVPYTTEADGVAVGTLEPNATLSVVPEVPYYSGLSGYESPCCQILAVLIYDGTASYNGVRTYGSDTYEA